MGLEAQRKPFSQRIDDPHQSATQHSLGDLGEQITPHTMSAAVDQAHIRLIQQVQHELRTPVHGLLNLLDHLRHDLRATTISDPQARKSLFVKVDSLAGLGERLQNVLDDFGDFAAETIQAREAEEEHNVKPEQPVDLGDLLDNVAAEAWNAQVRQIRAEDGDDARLPPPPELILQIDTSLRGWKTVVDVALIKKLAHKLISNALRFTSEGFVEVSLSPSVSSTPWSEKQFSFHDPDAAEKPQQNFIDLVVQDSGEGMTEHFLSHHLFEPFVKADQFKAGAGLSVNLCSSIVRRMGGAMHVSSDKGRGTVVTVRLPVQSLPERIIESAPPSQPDQLIYLYGFKGMGLERLAQVISAQMATFGNLYCTSHIEDADFLLLPEEVCLELENGIDDILARTKRGVKIGVLQAHEDAGIEYAAFKHGSRRPTFVTRKPFGPRCFANLLRLAEQQGEDDQRTCNETFRREHGHLGYTAPTDPSKPESVLPKGAGSPLSKYAKLAETIKDDDAMQHHGNKDLHPRRMSLVGEQEDRNRDSGSTAIPGADKLADLVVPPDVIVQVLQSPQPKPQIRPPPPPYSETSSAQPNTSQDGVTSTPSRKTPKFSVLCCEDNPLNMRILTTMLRQSGVEFYEAVDGVQAVEQFKKHLPAVTLLDINMPHMMGFEACVLMRKHVSEQLDAERKLEGRFRIVAVTALSDAFHQQRGLECGMDAWFTKPLQMRKLKGDLAEWKKEFEELVNKADKQ
ncbi:Sensor histidine kinase/response regulator [Pseudozyma hubeiensis]|nr:Sensor histidine kinase/response regulator [Pseudozyma hubeiensis]